MTTNHHHELAPDEQASGADLPKETSGDGVLSHSGKGQRVFARRASIRRAVVGASIVVAVVMGLPMAGTATSGSSSVLDFADAPAFTDAAGSWDSLGTAAPEVVAPGAVTPGVVAPGVVAPGAVVAPNVKVVANVVSSAELVKLVEKNFPAAQIGNAMAIADCESGQTSIQGDPNFDGTTDWGVFQLNDGGTLQGALAAIGRGVSDRASAQRLAMDAAINVKAAAAIWRDRGWAPWVCAYKQQIVNALWSNAPGPMYGRFTIIGKATGPIPTVTNPNKKKPAKKPAPSSSVPVPAPIPTPTPTPIPTPTPCPTGVSPSPSPTPAPTPSESPSPPC